MDSTWIGLGSNPGFSWKTHFPSALLAIFHNLVKFMITYYRSKTAFAKRIKSTIIYIYIYIYIYVCVCVCVPPLWSSGQSFWLQIQRSRVRSPALPDFLSSTGSGTGSTQPREVKLRSYLNKKVAAPGSENRY